VPALVAVARDQDLLYTVVRDCRCWSRVAVTFVLFRACNKWDCAKELISLASGSRNLVGG
jgi:hypothetical protein